MSEIPQPHEPDGRDGRDASAHGASAHDAQGPPPGPAPEPPPGPAPEPAPPGPSRPPGPPSGLVVGDAMASAWTAFQRAGGTLVATAAIVLAAWVLLLAVLAPFFLAGAVAVARVRHGGPMWGRGVVGIGVGIAGIIVLVVIVVVVVVAAAMFAQAGLAATRGRPVTLGSVFGFADVGGVLALAGMVALVALILSVLSRVPVLGWLLYWPAWLVIGFFLQFAVYFVVDTRMSAVDAIRSSVALVTANVSTSVLLYLVVVLMIMLGAALFGLGLLLALPLAALATASVYRTLLGEPAAA